MSLNTIYAKNESLRIYRMGIAPPKVNPCDDLGGLDKQNYKGLVPISSENLNR